ncbi:hypothetical protein HJC23_013778 [Cyclotella cryptica]|uniref:Uncharacterized protein n=1 Tax=Cyclotella cryptica TaxID=29204 RepID=A0ABD3PGJ8_9STRA
MTSFAIAHFLWIGPRDANSMTAYGLVSKAIKGYVYEENLSGSCPLWCAVPLDTLPHRLSADNKWKKE